MAQFDVHRNLGRSRAKYPYLIVVQSGLLRGWERRVVVPLALAAALPEGPDEQLNPAVMVQDQQYRVVAHEITNVPLEALGDVVANLAAEAETIISAVDLVLSRGFA